MIPARQLLSEGVAALRQAGINGAPRDARWLLAHALDVAPDRLMLVERDLVGPAQAEAFRSAIAARAQYQPVAQIIGQRLFWGRSFHITRDVLDPRPETETLIAAALERDFTNVLDLGTGCGVILLTLLAEREVARGLGVDLSDAALAVARRNSRALGLGSRARFVQSDWCAQVTGQFDLIVSNPPYISAADHATLAPEPRLWEPRMALVPDACDGSGLGAYRAILAQAPDLLRPSGRLLVEFGLGQGPAILELMAQAGLTNARLRPDMTGRARVAEAHAQP